MTYLKNLNQVFNDIDFYKFVKSLRYRVAKNKEKLNILRKYWETLDEEDRHGFRMYNNILDYLL